LKNCTGVNRLVVQLGSSLDQQIESCLPFHVRNGAIKFA
jgi:hypothetical protein